MHPAVRFVNCVVLAATLVAVLVAVVLSGRSPSAPQSLSSLLGGGTQQTQWGPLSAADRDMLIKVRQANLWEGPTGEQAAQRAVSPEVREVGRKLGVEHAQLDASLRKVADQLGVALPNQPSDQQSVWMDEIAATSGPAYDQKFVDVVRAAHGEVMPLVEGVRSGTQNELVRLFAKEASDFIARHMDYLESTGLVNYKLLPPTTAPAARQVSLGGIEVSNTLILFAVAVVVCAALLRGIARMRRRTDRGTDKAGRNGRKGNQRGRGATTTTAELLAVLNPESNGGPPQAKKLRGPTIPAQRANLARNRRPQPTLRHGPQRPQSGTASGAVSGTGANTVSGTMPKILSRPAPDARDRRPPKLRRTSRNRGW